jgi:RNA polymerase sigma factor (sigma-70 family)
MSRIIDHLRRAALLLQGAGLTDGELLEAFTARRDGASFEALVRRHASMVFGVCRRVLRDTHDAEDAFQATFLVLVRRAATVPRGAVGNWLYGVAYRTALNARRAAARRRARERPEVAMPHPATEPTETWEELRPLLDQELSRLPDKYRSAVVLCDLEGRTRKEAAHQLGLPEGTVSGRLTTARRMLADRLTRRGLTLSVGSLAAVLAQGSSSAAVPTSLVAATVQAAGVAAGAAAAGVVSAEVVALADGVVKSLAAAKWKPLAVVLLAAPVVGVGAAVLSPRGPGPGPAAAVEAPDPPAPRLAERPDREKLQGTWVAVSQEIAGESQTDPALAETQFVFAGDRVTYRTGRRTYEGTYRLDPTRSPKVLDLVLDEPGVMNCIYEVTDTRLKWCWTKGGPRPGGFDTAKEPDGTVLFVFEKR